MAFDTKKREARKSLHQAGWITLEGGFAARPCVVRDLSSSGAKLTIDDPNTLPAKLRLAFSRDARTGRPCEVVWRRGQTVGIKFVRWPRPPPRGKGRDAKDRPDDCCCRIASFGAGGAVFAPDARQSGVAGQAAQGERDGAEQSLHRV